MLFRSGPADRQMDAAGTAANVFQVLLVEDNPGDVRLTQEAFRGTDLSVDVHVVGDGPAALAYLTRADPYGDAPRPHLILLDLSLPGMAGSEVLARIKSDDRLRAIPIVILTASSAQEDVDRSYRLQANLYVSKPAELDGFEGLVTSLKDFWLTKAALPPG